jgi:hypothetical protein
MRLSIASFVAYLKRAREDAGAVDRLAVDLPDPRREKDE